MPIPANPVLARVNKTPPVHRGLGQRSAGNRSIPAFMTGIEARSSVVLKTAGNTVENGIVA
jgi:hypothetical protein